MPGTVGQDIHGRLQRTHVCRYIRPLSSARLRVGGVSKSESRMLGYLSNLIIFSAAGVTG